ncbi:MAG: dephospho-CoA kinase [Pseudomonadota bacterium]|nr:dephospho-CoA kinase [Pseudomonadota bacterium]
MFVVGLTGGIGSGKSAATSFFEELGINVVDADLASREAVMPGSNALMKIHERFGDDILLEDKTLNRGKLREIIFDNSEEKIWLEQLLHPEIRDIIQFKLKSSTSDYVILVSPLLFETDQYDFCDLTILIDTSESSQIARTSKRDEVSEDSVKKIIQTQMSRENKLKLANIVINNDNTLEELKKNVEKIHKRIFDEIKK